MYNYQCIVVPSIKEKFAVDELTRHNFGNRGRPMKSEEDETLEDNTILKKKTFLGQTTLEDKPVLEDKPTS